jgi:hypothetical protein
MGESSPTPEFDALINKLRNLVSATQEDNVIIKEKINRLNSTLEQPSCKDNIKTTEPITVVEKLRVVIDTLEQTNQVAESNRLRLTELVG